MLYNIVSEGFNDFGSLISNLTPKYLTYTRHTGTMEI